MSGTANGESPDSEGSRRYLIATAVSRYPKCPDWDRPGLVQAREQVIDLFTGHLGYRHESALGLDPTVQQLREQLRAFCTSTERREDDLVVVYLSGHGEVLEDGSEHMLLMSDTDPADVAFTSLPTADLVRVIRGTRVRRLLLILDTCYSGQGGNELAAAALERLGTQRGQSTTGVGLVIVSSAQPHQQAKAGLFPELFSQAVGSRATAGHAPAHLSVSAVVQQMNSHPDKPAYQQISLSLLGLTGEPPDFLANPRYNVRLTDVDLAIQDAAEFDAYARRRDTELTTRLLVRAMGYHGDGAHGWWFCGRYRVLAELADWLNQAGPIRTDRVPAAETGAGDVVRIVTAGPGSGKTAVLGLVSALALPERRRTVPVDTLGLHEEMIPGEGSIDVVMYAQNLTNSEVLGGLAAAAGLKSTRVGDLLEELERQNGGRGRPFTALIDALDEAATPDTLCSQIIRPLIEHSQGRIRLLLGTRPYLLDHLGIKTHTPAQQQPVIDLDSPGYADRQALLAYTMRNLIQSRHASPYRTLNGWEEERLLRDVAKAVADAAGTSFLVARFAAYTLASAETVADPCDPAWRASLPRHAGQAMRDDLTRRLGPDAQRAADLLRPLAYAEGQGLPWEDIWAPLASAVSGRTYTDDDLLWLRGNAGSYVVEATENGRSAYRLYHQALTEHLREGTDASTVHRAFVDTLTACVPYRGDATRDWSRAHPYTLHHLATHAAAAGCFDDVLDDSEYLVHARPDTLTPQLRHATSDTARLTAAIYRTAFHLHAPAPASVRRIALALNAARAGAAVLHEQLTRQAPSGAWIPTSATGSDFTTALQGTITVSGEAVSAVACTVLDGTPIAITGGKDSIVRVWDLATRQLIGEPLTGHTRAVSAVACTVLDGTPIAITGGEDSIVRVWDLATRQLIGELFTGHTGAVETVVCTVLDGTPIAITSGFSGGVRVWDLATRQPIGEPLTKEAGVHAVACTVLDGTPIAIASGIDGGFGIGVWDLATRQLIGKLFTGHLGAVSAVACTVLDGTPIAIASGYGGGVRVWDLATRQPIGELFTGHPGAVSAVACTVLDGTPIAITSGSDGAAQIWDLSGNTLSSRAEQGLSDIGIGVTCTVLEGTPIAVIGSIGGNAQIWDLAARQPIGKPLTGHVEWMEVFACTVLDGTPIAITGGDGGTVRVWDLATRRPIGELLTERIGVVRAVACTVLDGTPIAITSGFSGGVWVWDLATRRPIGELHTGHIGAVSAVACMVHDGTPIAIVSEGGATRVWDLATRQPIGKPLGDASRGLACTVLDGTPIAITGGYDGIVRIWDLRAGQLMQTLVVLANHHVALTSDGRMVVVLGRDIAVFERT